MSLHRTAGAGSARPRLHTLLLAGAGALSLAATALAPRPSDAAGLLVADGGFGGVLEIQEHQVQVTVNNGVAVTTVEQVFRNTERRQVEALYTFPVPKGASVSNFSMWIGGKEMVGEVVEKQRARQIYESYKQTRRDPGLLEQVDHKTFEMRIFPIGPEAEQRVRLTYYQELDVDHDWARYVYPLATASRDDADARTTGRFAFSLEAKSAVPITEMGSPSHGDAFVIAKHAANYVQASLEVGAGAHLNRDVVVSYRLSRPQTGVDLITSRRDGEDGTFCLTLTAGEEATKLGQGMDYVFVMDISGSMADDGKLLLSKDSVSAFLGELGPEDRFEVLTFNVQSRTLFGELAAASDETVARAGQFLAGQQARGGTILDPALTTAYRYRDADRTLNVVVLSDGMTEQRERAALLQRIRSRPGNTRVFCIGVGNEVNRPLLEQLAEDSGGLAAFLSRGDDFQRQAQAFRRKLTHAVAADIEMQFAGVEVFDLEPPNLPNLYHGSPVRVYGRYRGAGRAAVRISADVRGVRQEQKLSLEFPKQDLDNPEIERMWAWHRVDRLLKQAERTGDRSPVVEEIVQLGEAHAIATEYTSFIVLENDAEYRRWKIERRNALLVERDRAARDRLRARLDDLRREAAAELGPGVQDPQQEAKANPPAPAVTRRDPRQPTTPSPATPQPQRRQSRNVSFGSGPVGPLFAAAAWALRRRRKQG